MMERREIGCQQGPLLTSGGFQPMSLLSETDDAPSYEPLLFAHVDIHFIGRATVLAKQIGFHNNQDINIMDDKIAY